MEENETMEGKDLAKEQKMVFEENVAKGIKNLKIKSGNTGTLQNGINVANVKGQYKLSMRGIDFGLILEDGTFIYNKEKFAELKKVLAAEELTLEELGLPDLEQAIDQEEQEQNDKKDAEDIQEKKEPEEGEEQETEKGDETPDLEEKDEGKEKIAKKYGIDSSQVIHLAKNKKVTQTEELGQIAPWTNKYTDIYVVPGKDEYSSVFIGVTDGIQEELEIGQNLVRGKNPDVTINRVDGDSSTPVNNVLSMYELGDGSVIAIVRGQYGQREALRCREQAGDKRVYWGSVIPEASGRNVYQQEPEVRKFGDSAYTSKHDLDIKAKAQQRQEDLEKRGLPTEKQGVQLREINGTYEQNRQKNIEAIVKDLKRKDDIIDELTVQPNYYEYKAEKILKMMEDSEDLLYADAIDAVEEQERGNRKEGGRTPGEQRRRTGQY